MTPESWQRREDWKKWIGRAKVGQPFKLAIITMAKKAFYAGYKYGGKQAHNERNARVANG